MKYKKYLFEDFLDDQQFINWVTNPTKESNQYWQSVIKNYPEKKDEIDEASKLLRLIHFRKLSVSERQKAGILINTISNRYSGRSKFINRSPKQNKVGKYAQIVAISLIFISIVAFFTLQFSGWFEITSSTVPVKEKITKENPAGRKSRFYLPDGSYVTLNAASEIVYYSDFKENREIWLNGEASFEVKEDSVNKFFVHTENLSITVKGTIFNVSAFKTDFHETISLISGKVNVACSNDFLDEAYDLIPGEKLSVDLESNQLTVSDLNMDDVIWSSGILVFKNDDIETFTKKIHRWYGVLINVSGTPGEKININGKFDNENLKNVLESLKFSIDINYEFDDNRVQILF